MADPTQGQPAGPNMGAIQSQLSAGKGGGGKTGAHNLLFTNTPHLQGFSPAVWKGFLESLLPKAPHMALSPLGIKASPMKMMGEIPGGSGGSAHPSGLSAASSRSGAELA